MQVLVVQNVRIEGLGRLAEWLEPAGCRFDMRRMDLGENLPPLVEGYGGLIILGGPMGAYEKDRYPYLEKTEALIREAAGRGLPVLGICLGAQLIAQALGARVYPNHVKEIGLSSVVLTDQGRVDPLFTGMNSDDLAVFQWHGDTFDLPEGAVLLAASPACRHQAFRYGERVYGLQFHLEVTAEMVASWAEAYSKELAAYDGSDPAGLVERFREGEGRLRQQAAVIGGNLAAIFTRWRPQLGKC